MDGLSVLDTMYTIFSENPFLGVGFHNFRYYNLQETGKFFYGHNTYLELLVEVGVIGTFLYLLFFLTLMIFKINLMLNHGRLCFLFYSFVAVQVSSIFLTALLNSSLLLLLIVSASAHSMMSRKVKHFVLIFNYNYAHFMNECLSSISSIFNNPLYQVLMNDGSSDDSSQFTKF